MEVVNAREADLTQNPHQVKASRLYDTEHAQVVHITLEPGESLKKHVTPVDVFFYVLEGRGIVEIGEDTKEVGPCWWSRFRARPKPRSCCEKQGASCVTPTWDPNQSFFCVVPRNRVTGA